MNCKKVKILYKNEVFNAVIEKDEHFVSGQKVVFTNKEGVTCIISKKFIKIIEDEKT